MFRLICSSILHLMLGVLLGVWKERVVKYSLIWWASSIAFIPLLVHYLDVRDENDDDEALFVQADKLMTVCCLGLVWTQVNNSMLYLIFSDRAGALVD